MQTVRMSNSNFDLLALGISTRFSEPALMAFLVIMQGFWFGSSGKYPGKRSSPCHFPFEHLNDFSLHLKFRLS
jgi:hypothetical protein